ncbi:uncharacterized protein NECHADRAFT_101386 [Fusarium vanettenii 77-13-4]|uniref:Uncharacterized protein n=1 Tax=Fusarium vanettenii (strain ATCC MYA-4622 / CBS 123669 / FGSC 9596 / NRRL 45880 / 77-13-4) TaxID=660122 RepID=C7YZE3_FUSV7|nr:uncharacterized protein NECHADRAFT_101386 [Fusarium vanettenii 77-13-4]EEU42790.1 predicted protein [Fusarium vanettenii 77-13-4]
MPEFASGPPPAVGELAGPSAALRSSLLLQIPGTSRMRVCVELVLAGYQRRVDIEVETANVLSWYHHVSRLEASCSPHYLIDRIPLNYPKVRLPFVLRLDLRFPADTHLPYRVLCSLADAASNATPPGRLPAPGLTLALRAVVLNLGDVFTPAGAVVFVASRVATQNAVATAVLDYNRAAH